MIATIGLQDVRIHAPHGFFEEEHLMGNEFSVDVEVEASIGGAASDDDLGQTVNYATIYYLLQAEMKKPTQLLEALAYRMGERILRQFDNAQSVKLKLRKLHPPLGGKVGAAFVEIQLAAAAGGRSSQKDTYEDGTPGLGGYGGGFGGGSRAGADEFGGSFPGGGGFGGGGGGGRMTGFPAKSTPPPQLPPSPAEFDADAFDDEYDDEDFDEFEDFDEGELLAARNASDPVETDAPAGSGKPLLDLEALNLDEMDFDDEDFDDDAFDDDAFDDLDFDGLDFDNMNFDDLDLGPKK